MQLTDLLTGELAERWPRRGLQLFPVLILNQRAQARAAGQPYFVLSSQRLQRHLDEMVIQKKSFDTEKTLWTDVLLQIQLWCWNKLLAQTLHHFS